MFINFFFLFGSFNPDGYFNPEVVKYRQLCAKSQRKRRLYSLQQYYHRLLKQILVSRKVNDRLNTCSNSNKCFVLQNGTTVEMCCYYYNIFFYLMIILDIAKLLLLPHVTTYN